MKKFLAVYTGSPDAFEKFQKQFPDAQQREAREKAGMDGWMQWVATHQPSITDIGAPLGRTKRITTTGIADIRNQLAGYTIVLAETHEAAAALFLQHPHLHVVPRGWGRGDGVPAAADVIRSVARRQCRKRGCRKPRARSLSRAFRRGARSCRGWPTIPVAAVRCCGCLPRRSSPSLPRRPGVPRTRPGRNGHRNCLRSAAGR